MKYRLLFLMAFAAIAVFTSCEKLKDTSNIPKEQLIPGKWNINRIQLKVYYNGQFAFDSIVKQVYLPENFVSFSGTSGFEYKFNNAGSHIGTYSWGTGDSIIGVTPAKTYRWKKITLTDVLCTVVNTETSPSLPGATIERYQTFVK